MWELFWWLLAGGALGLLFSVPLYGVLTGALLAAGWSALQSDRLLRWLAGAGEPPPPSWGLWDRVFQRVWKKFQRQDQQLNSLQKSLSTGRDFFSRLDEAVLLLDANLALLWCNGAAGRLLGLSMAEDRGRRVGNLLREPELVGLIEAADPEREGRFQSPSNPQLTLTIRCLPLAGMQRVVHARDHTQINRAECLQRDFISNISHELRTPLTALLSWLELLDQDGSDGEQRSVSAAAIHDMRSQAARIDQLVEKLLALERAETLSVSAPEEPLAVAEMLTRLCRDRQYRAGPGRSISVECAEGLVILGDGSELYSVFANLVDNAIRHTEAEGGTVRLHAISVTGAVEIAVEDNGIGIEPRHIPRLTERFYQADRSRAGQHGGIGLGLSIVRSALERHQAELHIDSSPGEGSRFACRFPLERSRGNA